MFGDECDVRSIYALKTEVLIVKGLAKIIEVRLDYRPTLFNEVSVEAIRTR
jgi:predicted oxidoreductase (fatty acid repression mutant protein)